MRGILAVAGATTAMVLCAAGAAHASARAVITGWPESRTTERVGAVAFKASEPAWGEFECSVDGGPWARCRSPLRTAPLTAGEHHVAVRLVGVLTDPTPDQRRWTVLPDSSQAACAAQCGAPAPDGPGGTRAPASRPPAEAADGCRDANARAGHVPPARLAAATLCLLNAERRRRGLGALRAHRRLAAASAAHARDMVRRRYFAHVSPTGRTLADRARRSGYVRRTDRRWAVGEVLAWRPPSKATPRHAMRGLMASTPHRRLLLSTRYRHAGAAVLPRTPLGGRGAGGTFVVVLGRR